jgi:glycosyltransferase involved in cell wall biosynthesis
MLHSVYPSQLATAVIELLADEEKRDCFGQNERHRVENHFTDEQLLDTVIEWYEKLLS